MDVRLSKLDVESYMNVNTAYLLLKNPYTPLFSDKSLMWLASTFAARGYRLVSASNLPVLQEGEVLLTNLRMSKTSLPSQGNILRLTSSTDRLNRLMLLLAYFHGKSPFFHATTESGSNELVQGFIRLFKKPFRRGYKTATEPAVPLQEIANLPIPEGRRVVLRVNVDWDEAGFCILERWCDRYPLRPTLSVAGTEIRSRTRRVKKLVERAGADVASHSWSHYVVLSSHGRRRQLREIQDNHRFLEDLCGRHIKGFVAPYTKYNRLTFELLEEAGYRWFIRSWLVHPLRLAGYGLVDLGVNFFFQPGWEQLLWQRLALSDLTIQLHLRDLSRYEKEIERLLREMTSRGVRLVDCETYFNEILAKDLI